MYFVEGITNASSVDSQVVRIGEYENLDDAVSAAMQTINQFLDAEYLEGMSAGSLFVKYQNHGRVPFIFSDAETTINVPGFNHFAYAMRRCEELCRS